MSSDSAPRGDGTPERIGAGILETPISRRALLARAAAGGLAVNGLGALLDACGGNTPASPTRLVITSGSPAVTLDPMVSLEGQSPLLWRCVYEPLLRFKGASTEIEPHLAQAYELDMHANRLVFHLRPGIAFSDGSALDAAAVKLNLERQLALKQGIAYALTAVGKVEAPDDHTVVVHLSQYSDGLLAGFASLYGLYMISPRAITDHKGGDWAQGWLRTHMVGTGPYVLQEYTPNQRARFARNPDYWAGWRGPHFDDVVVEYVTDASAARLELERGDSEAAIYLPDDVVFSMRHDASVNVADDVSFNVYYLGLPCRHGPTADKLVRQAISYGFDYETWVRNLLNGTATQARGPLPSTFPGYDAALPQYHYDVDRARRMLSDAGYAGGGFALKFIYETGYYWKRPLGELFQANMKDLGIRVAIQELSPSTWLGTLSNKRSANEAFGVAWWPSLTTPYDYLWALFATSAQGAAGFNFTYYSNPGFDALLQRATSERDEGRRAALYSQCQRLLVDDAPYLYLSDVRYLLPMNPRLRGYVFNGMYINTFDPYSLRA